MAHLKRMAMPKTWPIARKGCKYIMSPLPGKNIKFCLPATIILRDLLKIASNKKEVRRIIKNKELLVNNREVKEEAFPIGFSDVISIPKIKKFYKVSCNSKGKLSIEEINEDKAYSKYSKVINKTVLKKNKLQLNFLDGGNIIVGKDYKANVNDCIVIDLKNKKIAKKIPYEKGAYVKVMGGKHFGKEGIIENIENKIITIKTNSGVIKTINKNLFICEK